MENECEFTLILAKMDVYPKIIGFINFASGASSSSTSTSWPNPTDHLKILESIKIIISQKYIYFIDNECEFTLILYQKGNR